jgi:DNA-binding NarL/FixJ family response regulator
MSIKILLVDDHQIVREILSGLIDNLNNTEVIGVAEDGLTAIKKAKKLSPDIVIMDMRMPSLNGIAATREIKSLLPDTHVIALSMHSERRYVLEMFKAGASAYLLKDRAFEDLVQAIQTVSINRFYITPGIADDGIRKNIHDSQKNGQSVHSLLTKRECEVLQFLSEGKTIKDIASHLKLSVKTVETYRQRIMEKLGINKIALLTKYAIQEGLTGVDF